jgi:hypothetical protein
MFNGLQRAMVPVEAEYDDAKARSSAFRFPTDTRINRRLVRTQHEHAWPARGCFGSSVLQAFAVS